MRPRKSLSKNRFNRDSNAATQNGTENNTRHGSSADLLRFNDNEPTTGAKMTSSLYDTSPHKVGTSDIELSAKTPNLQEIMNKGRKSMVETHCELSVDSNLTDGYRAINENKSARKRIN